MEEYLVRLAATSYKWILRGGIVMNAWCQERGINRPASDIDVSCLDLSLDAAVGVCRELCTGEFRFIEVIETWAETPRPGRKLTIAKLDVVFNLDIATMDPVVDDFIVGPYGILTVSPETAFAWKLHSLFELGEFWHPRHLMDLYLFVTYFDMDKALLCKTIKLAFESRNTDFSVLERMFMGHMGVSSGARHRWRQLRNSSPEIVRDVVLVVGGYVKDVLVPLLNHEKPIIKIVSFGYSHGIPETNMRINVRHWPPPPKHMREKYNGTHACLADELFHNKLFAKNYADTLERIRYAIENTTTNIIIGIGCEEGQYCSVAIVEKLCADLPGPITKEHLHLKN